MRTLIALSLSLFTMAACGGSKKEATGPTGGGPPAGKMSPEAAASACLTMFQRQRECTDVFIPALVGWRVELDVPSGVAAADASEGREALVTKAKSEWAASNSDEQLTELCANVLAGIPSDQLPAMMEMGQQCIAAETCEGYTSCIEPMQRQRLEAQKAGESGAAE